MLGRNLREPGFTVIGEARTDLHSRALDGRGAPFGERELADFALSREKSGQPIRVTVVQHDLPFRSYGPKAGPNVPEIFLRYTPPGPSDPDGVGHYGVWVSVAPAALDEACGQQAVTLEEPAPAPTPVGMSAAAGSAPPAGSGVSPAAGPRDRTSAVGDKLEPAQFRGLAWEYLHCQGYSSLGNLIQGQSHLFASLDATLPQWMRQQLLTMPPEARQNAWLLWNAINRVCPGAVTSDELRQMVNRFGTDPMLAAAAPMQQVGALYAPGGSKLRQVLGPSSRTVQHPEAVRMPPGAPVQFTSVPGLAAVVHTVASPATRRGPRPVATPVVFLARPAPMSRDHTTALGLRGGVPARTAPIPGDCAASRMPHASPPNR